MQTEKLTIVPPGRALSGAVNPPGSKSITNRALLLAGLAKGTSRLTGALKSDDTRYMADALRAMGVSIDEPDATTLVVTGSGKLNPPPEPLFLGNRRHCNPLPDRSRGPRQGSLRRRRR